MTLRQRKRRLRSLMVKSAQVGDCIEWTGSRMANGYGQYRTADDNLYVHRMVLEAVGIEIPEGHEVHHICGNPSCIDPFHLQIVTRHKHWALGDSPSAVRARATHCVRGHPFDEANTHMTKRGHRRCRACHRQREFDRRGGTDG